MSLIEIFYKKADFFLMRKKHLHSCTHVIGGILLGGRLPKCIKPGQGCRRSRRISSVSVRRATLDMFRRLGATFVFVVHIFLPGKNFFFRIPNNYFIFYCFFSNIFDLIFVYEDIHRM